MRPAALETLAALETHHVIRGGGGGVAVHRGELKNPTCMHAEIIHPIWQG